MHARTTHLDNEPAKNTLKTSVASPDLRNRAA